MGSGEYTLEVSVLDEFRAGLKKTVGEHKSYTNSNHRSVIINF